MRNNQSIAVKAEKIKPNRSRLKKLGLSLVLVFIAFPAIIVIGLTIYWGQVFGQDFKQAPAYIRLFLTEAENGLSSRDNRTNFLILGTAGGEHEGADLTDTMIFLSTDLTTGDSMMMNVPRDIWVPALVTKINAVYHYGEEQGENGGFKGLKTVFDEFFGQNIDYFFLIDFGTFTELIDLVGGIDVVVDRTFDDYQYPIPGKEKDECGGDPDYRCRWEHLRFERGLIHMNGQLALKFVRSRNAEGEEGTDFARSQRQQKVMMALKNRLVNWRILSSPQKVKAVYEVIKKHLVVDPRLSDKELVGLGKLGLKFWLRKTDIRILNLETGDDDNPGFLFSPPLEKYGQWVLEPLSGDWTKIREFVDEKIKGGY